MRTEIHVGPPPNLGECAHCWHGTGIQLCSMPPQAEEICCWCGIKRYLQVFPAIEPGENHGPHNPHGMKTPDAEVRGCANTELEKSDEH